MGSKLSVFTIIQDKMLLNNPLHCSFPLQLIRTQYKFKYIKLRRKNISNMSYVSIVHKTIELKHFQKPVKNFNDKYLNSCN